MQNTYTSLASKLNKTREQFSSASYYTTKAYSTPHVILESIILLLSWKNKTKILKQTSSS